MSQQRSTRPHVLLATALAAASLLAVAAPARAQQAVVAIDNDDIGGVVRGPSGPEAGVWVIAETTELPTKFTKIVVTDDQGRFVIPDLPQNVNYEVWVRGYGLVDSPKLRDLTAVPAPDQAAAAHYYPAIYWFTLLKIPPAKDFGGTTDIPGDYPGNLAAAHEQRRLRRLPSAWPGIDPHHSGCLWRVQVGRAGLDAPRFVGADRRMDDQPPRG
jgi:hypothetical protein